MAEVFHSVTLDRDMCKGCTNCIKLCPTQAIRVRNGKAKIIKERCIDCGECIRVCPHHAKKAITDPFDAIYSFKYKVALPAPALYGQFKNAPNIDTILTGLKRLGFDKVYEVSYAAEVVTGATRKLFQDGGLKKPVISSACPAVLRLISVRFPGLIENVLPLISPMDVAAAQARAEAAAESGLKPEEIGVFFITPCPAKATTVKSPLGIEKSSVSGAISMKDIYLRLAPLLPKITNPEKLSRSGISGVSWAKSGGEGDALGSDLFIAVDGINNCIKLLEEVDNDRLNNVDFIELSACAGGCVGGPLTVENPYLAKLRVSGLAKAIGKKQTELPDCDVSRLLWSSPIQHRPVLNLDTNMIIAMRKMEMMESILKGLPGLDCGSCGAPSCGALAEDIVRGFACEADCIFKLREKVRSLAMEMMELESQMPPSFEQSGGEEGDK